MNKVKQIIKEEFDERLSLMALTYTLGQLGMDRAATLTEADIDSLEGNGLMTKSFVQALAKTAKRIGTECDFVNDIVPYIVTEFDYLVKEDEDESY